MFLVNFRKILLYLHDVVLCSMSVEGVLILKNNSGVRKNYMYKDIFKNYKLIPREEYKKCSLSENEKTILCEEGLPDISEDILPWLTFNRNCPIFLNNNVQRQFNYKFIVIAYSYELPICIGENNEIVSIDLWFKEPIQYVNKNLESFLEYISIYLTYYNKLEAVFDFDDSHEEERVRIVTEMRKELSHIDKSALDNIGNFWSEILEQLEDGLL